MELSRRNFIRSAAALAAGPVIGKAAETLSGKAYLYGDQPVRTIPRELFGTAVEWRADISGLWRADLDDFDPDVVRLSKELGTGLVRFPGGFLSDFYHWREGIGPRDNRIEVPGWTEGPLSYPYVGTDEMLNFVQRIDSQLLITANAGTGTAQEAGDWVHYVNDGNTGRVKWWEIGNELYNVGGFAETYVTTTPINYAAKFNAIADAMHEADKTIKVGAIGCENFGKYILNDYPGWDYQVLTLCAEKLDFIALHNAFAPVNIFDQNVDVRSVYSAMLAAPQAIKRNLKLVGNQIEQVLPLRQASIRIGVTEWGPLFSFEPSPYVLHVRTLGSAIYIASVLKQLIDAPRVALSCTFNLVSADFIGWIGKQQGTYIGNAQYLAMQMFTQHFGQTRIISLYGCPTFDSPEVGVITAEKGVPYLDLLASVSTDKKTLYIMGINKHFDSPIAMQFSLTNLKPRGDGTAWVLRGTGIDANRGADLALWGPQATDSVNPRFMLGGPDEVTIDSQPIGGVSDNFNYTFPQFSITSLEIPLR